jgi:HK97 family phage major capsid protein
MHKQNMTALAATGAAIVLTDAAGRVLPRALTHGHRSAPIIKADASDPKALFEELRRSVEALRSDIPDEQSIRNILDPLIAEKETKINETITNLETALDTINARLEAQVNAPVIGDIKGNPEYVTNFKSHMRKGDDVDAQVKAAMSIGTAADGGYLAPVEWDRSITEALIQESPIRANSETINISGQGFSRLYATGAPGSGWVGETAARPQTSTPQFTPLEFRTGELYANPAITQTALDDAAIDLEAWLRNSVRNEFSRQENIAFLSGDGVNKPYGILTYVEGGANAARHPLGPIEAVVTEGNLAAGVAPDDFFNVIYDLPAERSNNAKWYMNRTLEAAIRKFKDLNGNYIWQPRLTDQSPSMVGGYPVVNVPGLPVTGASAVVALFGDMRATYLVIDRVGIRVLRDPYTNKPFVMFYTTKRVGGGVQNPEYMRALTLAAA